jgi:hypothetical protein
MKKKPDWTWPSGKRIAVILNVSPEAWSDGKLRIIDVPRQAHIFGHHRGAPFYEKIIKEAMAAPDIWVGTRVQVADHVLSSEVA